MTLSTRLGFTEINIQGISDTINKPINVVSFCRLSGSGMTSLILPAEMSDDCAYKCASLVRARDLIALPPVTAPGEELSIWRISVANWIGGNQELRS